MTQHLIDIFSSLLDEELPPEPTLVTIRNVGNWKALLSKIRTIFPETSLKPNIRHPVILGQNGDIIIEAPNEANVLDGVSGLLQANDKVFVFNAEASKIFAPDRLQSLMHQKRYVGLFFRHAMGNTPIDFYLSNPYQYAWKNISVDDDMCLSAISTRISETILRQSAEQLSAVLSDEERLEFETLKNNALLMEEIAIEIEDHFLEASFGLPKLRQLADRNLICALLKETAPAYSVRNGDPVLFFEQSLKDQFTRFSLPSSLIDKINPNLSYAIKTSKRFSEITQMLPSPKTS